MSSENEKYVRENCVDVEFRDDSWPQVYAGGKLLGSSSYEAGDTEEDAWKSAAQTVRATLSMLDQLKDAKKWLKKNGGHKVLDAIVADTAEKLSVGMKGQRVAAERVEGNNAKIATGCSAGLEKDTVLPAGQRSVQNGAAGDHGELLRGDAGTEVIEGAAGNLREGGCAARRAECADKRGGGK